MAVLNFNARTVEPDAGRSGPVPSGWYEAIMVESEMKPNSAGTGEYLRIVFDITNGVFKGSKLFHQLNLRNPSEKAMQISYGQLSAICHAVNLLDVQDSSQLHNRPLKLNVKLKPAEGEYEAKNEITAFASMSKETPPSPTAHEPIKAAAAAPKAAWQPGAPAAAPAAGAPWAGQQPAAAPVQGAPWAQQQQPQAQAPVQQPQQQAPAPQQQPQGQPAWQPPAGAQPQPWAQQPAQQAQQPAAAPAIPPAATPQPWTPQPAPTGGAPAQSAVPPWAQQPQGPAQ